MYSQIPTSTVLTFKYKYMNIWVIVYSIYEYMGCSSNVETTRNVEGPKEYNGV